MLPSEPTKFIRQQLFKLMPSHQRNTAHTKSHFKFLITLIMQNHLINCANMNNRSVLVPNN